MIVRGVNKCPLGYVKRDLVVVTAHEDDPSTGYANIDEEMTARAPRNQFVYGVDNRALWYILHVVLKDHPSYTSIRSFARTQNGREAYLALILHN